MKDKEKTPEPETYRGELVALQADFGRLYMRRHEGQLMKPIEAKMTLSQKKGQLYSIPTSKGPKYHIASTGYIHLNKVASINLVTPQRVAVDGVSQPNPYVERDEDRMVLTVNIRKIAIGFSPAGNLTVLDKTLFYNIYTYLIQSFQSKMKKQKKDKPVVVLGTPDDRPAAKGKWAFYRTTPPLGFWVNYESQEIKECIEEHIQRQRFADRIAQKIVERNLLKDHPAIGASQVQVDNQGKASVTVWGYRHPFTSDDVQQRMRDAERGEAEPITVEPEEEKAEVAVAAREEAEEEAPAEAPKEEKKEEPKKSPAELTDPGEDPLFKPEKDKEK